MARSTTLCSPYTPGTSMQPQPRYPTAAWLLEVPLALAVGSVTLPSSAQLLLCGASPYVHKSWPPQLQGCLCLLVSSPGPFAP